MKSDFSIACVLALCLAAAAPIAAAAEAAPQPDAKPAPEAKAEAKPKQNFVSSNDVGDHYRLTTDMHGFLPVSEVANDKSTMRCAGESSTFSIVDKDSNYVYVMFYKVFYPKSLDTCPQEIKPSKDQVAVDSKGVPHPGSVYKIAVDKYSKIEVRSNGIAFGALVVPFKFRLGGDKKLVSSATIAPFMGIRWSVFQRFGFEAMPVFSAGLGLVPVTDPATTKTETRAAFSTAAGFTVSSKKNADFSAGFLFGKDFLNKTDRLNDPSVNKLWVSLWLGIAK